jgi:ABC-type branched-subunit amino acid transport system ATPase component
MLGVGKPGHEYDRHMRERPVLLQLAASRKAISTRHEGIHENYVGDDFFDDGKRVLAFARALASNPKVLLLDEPTEGIQPSIIKDLARLLREIRNLRNICIVVCEQVLSFVLDIADRILVMEGGRIVHADTRDQVDEAAIARFLAV